MLAPDTSAEALAALFAQHRVVVLDALFDTLKTTSRTSVFRRLSPMGYLTSYSHAGRYYTLRSIPFFDTDGLWQHQGVLFSAQGSLKEAACHLIETSEAGRTHEDLRDRLRIRVHNTLLDLVEEKRIQRELLGAVYLYLSGDAHRAQAQRARLHEEIESMRDVAPHMVVQILVEIIHGAPALPKAAVVAARLAAQGFALAPQAVQSVYKRYGLEKKRASSRSRRSERCGS